MFDLEERALSGDMNAPQARPSALPSPSVEPLRGCFDLLGVDQVFFLRFLGFFFCWRRAAP